jgi:hypothetical protein
VKFAVSEHFIFFFILVHVDLEIIQMFLVGSLGGGVDAFNFD